MIDIPSWLKKSLSQFSCPHCAVKMTATHVVGIGIRKSSKYQDKTVFFFEYHCSKCDKNAFVELDFMTVEDFVMQMVDEYIDKDAEKENKNTKKGKKALKDDSASSESMPKQERISSITEGDIKKVAVSLEKIKTWDDLLTLLGFTEEEIDKNKKAGEQERKAFRKSERDT